MKDEISAIQRRLRNEASGDQDVFETSGSLKELIVQPDPDAEQPQR